MPKRTLVILPRTSPIAPAFVELAKTTNWRVWNDEFQGAITSEGIESAIDDADTLVVDVSLPTFNLGYAVGYAIGRRTRITLLTTSRPHAAAPRESGLFESIGVTDIPATELALFDAEAAAASGSHHELGNETPSQHAPVYYVTPRRKGEADVRILSRIKKARLQFRTFDPEELGRLSAREAIAQVTLSHAVIGRLLENAHPEAIEHNVLIAFVVGLAVALDKLFLLLQPGDEPVTIKYQQLVTSFHGVQQIDKHIGDFAPDVTDRLQAALPTQVRRTESLLDRVNLGASAAENEMAELGSYYLPTDQYQRATRGEVEVVAGRKGTGKTALFFQLRNDLRRNKQHIVLDLMPEGFQLLKFKERVVGLLTEGTKEHIVTAFWEYILLLETGLRILRDDNQLRFRDHRIFEPYSQLSKIYNDSDLQSDGDFSERMLEITKIVGERIHIIASKYPDKNLTIDQVTEALYHHDVPRLRQLVLDYLQHKDELWILLDNIDKGWPSQGLASEDILIVRCLVAALGKTRRALQRKGTTCRTLLFIRNDVYDLLVESTPDKGKIQRVNLDWSDPAVLRELLRRRFIHGMPVARREAPFDDLWRQIAVSHISGEESSQFLIDRSLMRPRFLLDLIRACRSHAINVGRNRIEAEDIVAGCQAFSTELITNISYELRDVLPEAEEVIYSLVESPVCASRDHMRRTLATQVSDETADRLLDHLFWYGVLGVRTAGSDEVRYIYSVHYDMRRLQALLNKNTEGASDICINPAFWAGLGVDGSRSERASAAQIELIPPVAVQRTSSSPEVGHTSKTFTLLHVSDLHCGAGKTAHQLDRSMVFQAMLDDIQVHSNHNIDGIAVTGDILYSGDSVAGGLELNAASEAIGQLLSVTRCERSRLFVVPGNHDIDRRVARDNRDIGRMLNEMRASSNEVDSGLSHPPDAQRLTQRQEAFLSMSSGRPGAGLLYWSHAVSEWLTVVGLNSALLCQDENDEGSLSLGKTQLTLIPPRQQHQAIIALTHHPLGWLRDSAEASAWFDRRVDVHLHGHLHDPSFGLASASSGSQRITIGAGAIHMSPLEKPDHAYSSVHMSINDATGELTVTIWPRRWSWKSKRFVVDSDNTLVNQAFTSFTIATKRG